MEALSFFEALEAMHVTEFNFTMGEKKMTSPREADPKRNIAARPASFYVTLILDTPIEVVTGTMKTFDPEEEKWIPFTEVDVTEIKVFADVIKNYSKDFTYNPETKTGRYAGNLILDVETRGEGVWLTDEKFSDFSKKSKHAADVARLQRVKDKIRSSRK